MSAARNGWRYCCWSLKSFSFSFQDEGRILVISYSYQICWCTSLACGLLMRFISAHWKKHASNDQELLFLSALFLRTFAECPEFRGFVSQFSKCRVQQGWLSTALGTKDGDLPFDFAFALFSMKGFQLQPKLKVLMDEYSLWTLNT